MQHIGVTMDAGGFVRLYKNGNLVGSGQTTCPTAFCEPVISLVAATGTPIHTWPPEWMKPPIYYVLSPARWLRHYYAGIGQGAILDRGNSSTGAFGFELNNASDITISICQSLGLLMVSTSPMAQGCSPFRIPSYMKMRTLV